ncbi:MAG: sialidase family protein, partial [Chitinophagaceae bacterium]
MKNLLTSRLLMLLVVSLSALVISCKNLSEEKVPDKKNNLTPDKQDGIAALQQWEFEMTKDVSLGYVPLNRLINATEELKSARQNGTYTDRTNALSWVERGPNSDAVGPSNGNTRGTQLATDAVTSGRMRAIWVDLTSSTIVWAGGVDGGLWKSTDITSTSSAVWSPVNDFFGNLAISSICQNPVTTDIMYFGTGEKTFNVDAVQGGGVWKSTDHGVTWSLLANTTGFTNVSKVLCDGSGNVYVSTIAFGTALGSIQRSTDGGASWTNIMPDGLTSGCTEMKISSTGRLHVVCGYIGAGVSGYRYTDIPATVTTLTWISPVTTFPTSFNSELAVAGTTLYALPSNASYLTPTIYKSTDGGANW